MAFTVVVFDYDAAPDAEEHYFVSKRFGAKTLEEARRRADHAVDEKLFVGAKVLDESGQEVYGVGVVLDRS